MIRVSLSLKGEPSRGAGMSVLSRKASLRVSIGGNERIGDDASIQIAPLARSPYARSNLIKIGSANAM